MTDRELYLRHELAGFQRNLESYFEMTPEQRKKYAPYFTPAWIQEHLFVVLERAFHTWNDLCNDNCKSMYFCEKKRGHKGNHGCCKTGKNKYGLGWEREPAVGPENKKR